MFGVEPKRGERRGGLSGVMLQWGGGSLDVGEKLVEKIVADNEPLARCQAAAWWKNGMGGPVG